MKLIKNYIGNLFFSSKFYLAIALCVLLLIVSFFYTPFLQIPKIGLFFIIFLSAIDYLVLFLINKNPIAKRIVSERLSNGDINKVTIQVINKMPFNVMINIIDELPVQFQKRDFASENLYKSNEQKNIVYTLRPIQRGEYHFGNIILYIKTRIGLIIKRVDVLAEQTIQVYPAYKQLSKYELLSTTTVPSEYGSKRMRKIGNSIEFEQIKEYVWGDDIRTINWKATARKGGLMINNYTEENTQEVYCIIDKGRLMKMPFKDLTLLDYAINSTLALTNICLKKQDKIGVITFSNKMGSIIASNKNPIQKEKILQLLYNQQTAFLESDFEMLYMQIRNKIKNRSLLILYTNFESLSGLRRQLNYLRSIAKHHLLMVVFFENTELNKLSQLNAESLEDIYIKTIAKKFEFEKRLIVKELKKHGIISILTAPENLTINTINKYLELKSRQAI